MKTTKNDFKFLHGEITLQEFLSSHNYTSWIDFKMVCDHFDLKDWYEEIKLKYGVIED